jgi:hypothetical protein
VFYGSFDKEWLLFKNLRARFSLPVFSPILGYYYIRILYSSKGTVSQKEDWRRPWLMGVNKAYPDAVN